MDLVLNSEVTVAASILKSEVDSQPMNDAKSVRRMTDYLSSALIGEDMTSICSEKEGARITDIRE